MCFDLEIHDTFLSCRYAYMKSSCMECFHCYSGDDIMCRKRAMFPEGRNNGYAYGAICDAR